MSRRARHITLREVRGLSTGGVEFNAGRADQLYDATSGGSVVADGGVVARWNDNLHGGYHQTQGTSGNRPTYDADGINGMPCVKFVRASSQYLFRVGPIGLGGNGFHSFALVKPDPVNTDQVRFISGVMLDNLAGLVVTRNAGSDLVTQVARRVRTDLSSFATEASSTVVALHENEFNAASGVMQARKNGSNVTTTSRHTTGTQADLHTLSIGAVYYGSPLGEYLQGEIGYFGVVPALLSDVVAARVRAMIARRWMLSGVT